MKPLCIISGGTSGIGLEIAKTLAPRFRLALIYKSNHSRAEEALTELAKSFSGDQALFSGNLGVVEEAEKIMAGIEEWDSRPPFILINGAGRAMTSFFVKDPLSYQLTMIHENLLSCMILTHLIARKMFLHRAGHIINISSVSAENAFLGTTSYAVAKAGIEAFTKNLSGEVYRAGVRVNCIRPGLIRSPMTERYTDSIDKLKDHLVPVAAVISALEYLLDPKSESISGTIVVAGKETIR
jgi:short-subunit dehydrogenase